MANVTLEQTATTTNTSSAIPVYNPLGFSFDLGGSGGAVDMFFVYGKIVDFLLVLWSTYSVLAFIFSAFFVFGTIYTYIRYGQLSQYWSDKFASDHKLWKSIHSGDIKNARWLDIQKHSSSNVPNDWKLAIIEADIMLDKALTDAGYAGDSLGQKLKSVPQSQLPSIRDAWDAHMVRNKIAHEGTDFVLTQKLTRDTMAQYKKVFADLNII